MSTYIALLRGINVGGTNRLAMADLRGLASELGFKEARTLLQSGNLLLDAEGTTSGDIERRLEGETERQLGLKIDYVVRTAKQWHSMIAANPYPEAALTDPSHLVVVFCKEPPTAVDALEAAIKGRETVRLATGHLYAVYPDGIGDSKLTMAVIERHLGVRGTARNWNTVLKLAAMVKA